MAEEGKVPQADLEELSGTKLLEFVKEISGHAEKEVERVSRIYKLAALGMSAIIATGVYRTFKDAAENRREVAEFRKDAREEMGGSGLGYLLLL